MQAEKKVILGFLAQFLYIACAESKFVQFKLQLCNNYC
jgi:hypothetical protein